MGYEAKYPPAHSDTYVKATSYNSAAYYPHFGTDPALSLTGTSLWVEWRSALYEVADQKFNIDLGSAFEINALVLDNSHHSGTLETRGIQDFTVYGTNSGTAFANTTYADTTDLTLLGTFAANAHVASDVADPQYFTFSSTGSYRYYILRISTNQGHAEGMGFRHLELLVEVPITLQAVSAAGAGGGAGSLSASALSVSGAGGGSAALSVGAVTVSGAGEVGALLEVAGAFPEFGGSFSLNSEGVLDIAGAFPAFYGGFQIDEIDIAGAFPEFGGSFSIESDINIEVAGVFPTFRGSMTAISDSPVQIVGAFPEFGGAFSAEINHTVEIAGEFPSFYGSMTASASEPEMEIAGEFPAFMGAMSFSGSPSCSGILTHVKGAVV